MVEYRVFHFFDGCVSTHEAKHLFLGRYRRLTMVLGQHFCRFFVRPLLFTGNQLPPYDVLGLLFGCCLMFKYRLLVK